MSAQPQSKVPLPFTMAEYDKRLSALRKRMAERGIDVLLVFIPENVFYLTGYVTIGYSNFQTLIIPRNGKPFLFIREMERLVAEATTWLEDFDLFADDEDPLQPLPPVPAAPPVPPLALARGGRATQCCWGSAAAVAAISAR